MSDRLSHRGAAVQAPRLIPDILDRACASFSENVLFKDCTGTETTYSQTQSKVIAIATRLVRMEYGTGERIALIGDRNCSAWCISYLGILRAGTVVVPLDPGLRADEIRSMLIDCEASAIVYARSAEATVREAARPCPSIRDMIPMDDLCANLQTESAANGLLPDPNPESLAVLIYTSGTTGSPKGVMLSHRNIVSDIEAVERTLCFNPNDVFLSILPLHHTFECTCGFLASMSKGCKIVFARSYKSSDVLEDIQQNRVTIMCGVPLIFEKMYLAFNRKTAKLPVTRRICFSLMYHLSCTGLRANRYWGKRLLRSVLRKAGLDSVRMFVSGGAALPFKVGQYLNAIGLVTVQGYGLSETSPVLSVNPVECNRFWTVGPPLNGIELRVLPDDPDGHGQIAVRGPMVMMGYYKNPLATSEVMRDGWFLTGDIGDIDSRGYLTITGRSKNVIVTSAGKNVYPEEIEARLNMSPLVLESLVLGMRSRTTGEEEIAAVIVPNREGILMHPDCPEEPDQSLVENMIRSEVRAICSQLADFKRIKRVLISDEELPKTTTRKIKRTFTIGAGGELIEREKPQPALSGRLRVDRLPHD